MGRYCSFCGEYKPNEKFSGKGDVCKDCIATVPKAERKKEKILQRLYWLPWKKLNQGQKNFLMEKLQDEDEDIRRVAEMAYDRTRHPQKYHILEKLQYIPENPGRKYMAWLERMMKHEDEEIRTKAMEMNEYIHTEMSYIFEPDEEYI